MDDGRRKGRGGFAAARTLAVSVPTIFSHAITAAAAAQWWPRRLPSRFWTWTIVCAMLPDIDVAGFSFGIAYEDMFGHRGFTHSFFFATLVGAFAAWQVSHPSNAPQLSHPSHLRTHLSHPSHLRTHLSHPSHLRTHLSHPSHASHLSHRIQLFVWFMAVTASHGLLDALTNGGRGIAFFAPFTNHRYFFPWRPIQVSPIGAGFFSARGLRVLTSEARWIWLPSAIIAVSARLRRRRP
jgi:inner membrane protein